MYLLMTVVCVFCLSCLYLPNHNVPLLLCFWYHWKAFDEKGACWFSQRFKLQCKSYWILNNFVKKKFNKIKTQNLMKIGEHFNTLETSLDTILYNESKHNRYP